MTVGSMDAHARLAALYAELSQVHQRLAAAAGDEFIDQSASPLGSRLHCRLVRAGELPGYRAGRRVLVRRADLEAYLQQHRIKPTEAGAEPDQADLLFSKYGGRAA